MGLIGWFSWLGEDLDKLKALREITKDEKQLSILDEVIEDIEDKKNNEE